MALKIYYREDLHAIIMAGIILELHTCLANGAHDLAGAHGALRLAEHQARAIGLSWPHMVAEIQEQCRADLGAATVFLETIPSPS